MTVGGVFGLWLEPNAASQPDRAGLLSALRHFAEIRGVQVGDEDKEESPARLYEQIMSKDDPSGLFGRFLKLVRGVVSKPRK
jgi:hypothetical protein